jgi:CO dehydrogenase nickel-insertion accessory protein CooC1
MVNSNKVFINKRIGILGKGGSGKSTVTVLLSQMLKKSGYHVYVLDSDSTNIGLHQALGFKKPPQPLLDYFGGTEFCGGLVSCPVDNPTPLPKANLSLNKIPNKYYLQQPGITLFTAGKIGDQGPGAGCDGPISKITRDFRIQEANNHPVTLIDVKAGLEDFSRGIVTSMDWIITVVDPSIASIQIAINIKSLVNQIKSGWFPATKHLKDYKLIKKANQIYKNARIRNSFVLLNKINNKETANYIKKTLKKHGIEPIGAIPEISSISMAWLKGKPLKNKKLKNNLQQIMKKLTHMIAESEKQNYN